MANKITNIIRTFLLVSIMLMSIIPFGSAQGFLSGGVACVGVYAQSLETWNAPGTAYVDDDILFDILFEAILDNDQDVDYYISSVDWFFGDSADNGGLDNIYSYSSAGSYNVKAVVHGMYNTGLSFSESCFSTNVNIIDLPELSATINAPDEAFVGESVTLTADVQNYPRLSELDYSWSVDGTGVGNGKTITHTFTDAGTQEINVLVTDTRTPSQNSVQQHTINIKTPSGALPTVTLTSSEQLIAVGDSVTFTADAFDDESDLMDFEFEFGNGDSDFVNGVVGDFSPTEEYIFQATSDSYTFTQEGTYNAKVTATNKFGNAAEDTLTINVVQLANSRPVAFATADTYFGNAPLDVNFDASDSFDPDGDIIDYLWTITNRDDPSFTDNEFGEFPSYVFTEPGTYDVRLVVVDEKFATSNEFRLTITVNKPVTNFEPVIPVIANQTAFKGESYTQKISAYDVYDPDITYSAEGLPDGLSIQTVRDEVFQRNVGIIQGTPNKLGDFKVTLTVSDTQGASSQETFFIKVIERPAQATKTTQGLVVTRANLNKVYFNVGELLTTNVKLENDGTEDWENLKITASIGQLGVLRTYTVKELEIDNSKAQLLGLEIPEYAPNGEYSVKLTISNNDIRRTLHRTFWITD